MVFHTTRRPRRAAWLCLALTPLALAQYPQPHAGWKLVPGAENLVQSSYWGATFYGLSYADTSAPPNQSISVSNGVLTVADPSSGYFSAPTTVGPWLQTTGAFGIVATVLTGPNTDGFIGLTGSYATGSEYWQGNTVVLAGVASNGACSAFDFDGTSPNVAHSAGTAGPGSPSSGQVTIEILDQGGQITVYCNGTALPPIPDTGLFSKGWVMPTIEAAPGQTLQVSQLALEVLQSDTTSQLVEPVGNVAYVHTGSTPGSLAPAAGKIFSLAAEIGEIAEAGTPNGVPNPGVGLQAIGQFGALGMYETGFDQVHPEQDWYDFDMADALMATARATGRTPMFCHGILGGGSDVTPYWVQNGNFTAAQLTTIIQQHIATVIGRYKGLCDSWTIINEALSDTDGTVNKGFFESILGESYISVALQAAHAADPNLKLFITDYGIENAGAKATGMYNLISSLKSQGVPIHGVGWEGHFTLNGPSPDRPNLAQMVANMAQLASLGVEVRFTELDDKILLPASAQNLADQATDYATVVQACLQSPNCAGVQAFDLDDYTSWINTNFPGYGAATMFDANFNPKPAYTAVMNALAAAPKAPPTIVNIDVASGGGAIAQNTFVAIRGFNLVPATTAAAGVIWSTAPDFAQGLMPTNLQGVSVMVNGRPAFVEYYCSAATSSICTLDQVNILTPLDNTTGSVQVVVTSANGSSAPFTVEMQTAAPTFLLFNLTGPIAATHTNYTLAGSAALYPGASTPAKPGELIVTYAVGFGLPTTPLTNGSATQSGSMPYTPSCQVGGANANAAIALIASGLYQINVTIPSTALSGNNAVTCNYNGVATQAGAFITVQQ
jgi:endo-1,4-beta-xylanase